MRDDTDELLYVPNFFGRPRAGFTPPSSANLGGAAGAAPRSRRAPGGQAVLGEGIFDDSREAVIDVVSDGEQHGRRPGRAGTDRRHGLQLRRAVRS